MAAPTDKYIDYNEDRRVHVLQSNQFNQNEDEERVMFKLHDKLHNVVLCELKNDCGKNIYLTNLKYVRRDDPNWYWFPVEGVDHIKISVFVKKMSLHFGKVGQDWDFLTTRGFNPTDYKDVIKLRKDLYLVRKSKVIDLAQLIVSIIGFVLISFLIDWQHINKLFDAFFAKIDELYHF